MTCWVIIPIKPLERAKLRLADRLTSEQRVRLVQAMLDHVEQRCRAFLGVTEVLLVTDGPTLNGALQAALAAVPDHVSRLLVLPGDLPLLQTKDIARLACVPEEVIAIAPDRHHTGTNALSVPLPAARGFTFAFGPASFALHQAEAARLDLSAQVMHSDGLARDVDVAADLPDAAALNWEQSHG